MDRFELLTRYLPLIETDRIGGWVSDEENDGTPEHPIRMAYVDHSPLVSRFMDDVYRFEEDSKDMELARYAETLRANGLEWDAKSMEEADVSGLDAKAVLALIMGAVRAERFSEGALLDFSQSGAISRWLERLKEME